MNVFVDPTGLHSRAMLRVSDALRKHAPDSVKIVAMPSEADLQIMHVIGYEKPLTDQQYVVIQYCMLDENVNAPTPSESKWTPLWCGAKLIWSYYDLTERVPQNVPFYLAPLGVNQDVFHVLGPKWKAYGRPRRGIGTSGFVATKGSEPIQEVHLAADRLGMLTTHIGPATVEGMTYVNPTTWTPLFNIDDAALVSAYNRLLWISGMRYTEGFEMSVIEGLSCGARPIVFDRADMRQWYEGHAVFIPEESGEELVETLIEVLSHFPRPVSVAERDEIGRKFNWKTIAEGFWEKLLS